MIDELAVRGLTLSLDGSSEGRNPLFSSAALLGRAGSGID